TFTGFGTLRDLDLQLVGERAVLGRDAEATRRDLFDRRVLLGVIAGGILATFAGVRLPAHAAKRDRQRLVRFLADGPVADRPGPPRSGRPRRHLLRRRPSWISGARDPDRRSRASDAQRSGSSGGTRPLDGT